MERQKMWKSAVVWPCCCDNTVYVKEGCIEVCSFKVLFLYKITCTIKVLKYMYYIVLTIECIIREKGNVLRLSFLLIVFLIQVLFCQLTLYFRLVEIYTRKSVENNVNCEFLPIIKCKLSQLLG